MFLVDRKAVLIIRKMVVIDIDLRELQQVAEGAAVGWFDVAHVARGTGLDVDGALYLRQVNKLLFSRCRVLVETQKVKLGLD